MSLEMYREDKKKQEHGSPCYINNMCFYVARVGTKKAAKQIKEIKERLYGAFPNPKEVDETEITAHWLAEFGVLNWEDVTDKEDGEIIPFDRTFARKLFLNEEYWLSLNGALINHAANFESYLHDQAYEDSESVKKK